MNSNQFYSNLSQIGARYSWGVQDNTLTGRGRRGRVRGLTVNPITAVAAARDLGQFGTNKRETTRAGKALGLPAEFINHVYDATNGATNRGNTQVVRGKIRSALEI